MNERCEVFCVGNAVADVLARPVESLPAPGGSLRLDQVALVPGGNGVITSIALARLGISARLAAPVGHDRLGQMIRETLQAQGVDCRDVVTIDHASTASTVVLVQANGERRLLHFQGASAFLSAEHLDWSRLEGARILHYATAFSMPALDGEPLVKVMARARQMGCTTSLNVCWDQRGRWLSLLRPVLPYTDIIFPNQDEGFQLTGEKDPAAIAACLRRAGVQTAVVKLGAEGCYVDGPEGTFTAPGFRVTPVDTTGAGDCFAAGFLAALCRGQNLQQAARFANATGALATLTMGGSDAAPTFEQVTTLIAEEG